MGLLGFQAQLDAARARRRCARCGDQIERVKGSPLCGGCRLWAEKMRARIGGPGRRQRSCSTGTSFSKKSQLLEAGAHLPNVAALEHLDKRAVLSAAVSAPILPSTGKYGYPSQRREE